MSKIVTPSLPDEAWRHLHLGRLLGHAQRKFDARVRSLMAQDDETPLASQAALLALLPQRPGTNHLQQLISLVTSDTAYFGESEPLNTGTLARSQTLADEAIPEDISPAGRRWHSAK